MAAVSPAGGRSVLTADGVRVHRRLDRTPERLDKFEKLSPEDKGTLYSLRAAVEGTKNKMSKLEDDLETKNLAIEKERTLRKAAEDRLKERLVDMYQSPKVNEELRRRLPRATRSDPVKTDTQRTDQWRREERLVSSANSNRVRQIEPAELGWENRKPRRADTEEDLYGERWGDVESCPARRSLDFEHDGNRPPRRKPRPRGPRGGQGRGTEGSSDGSGDDSALSGRGSVNSSRTRKSRTSQSRQLPRLPTNSSSSFTHPTNSTNPYPANFIPMMMQPTMTYYDPTHISAHFQPYPGAGMIPVAVPYRAGARAPAPTDMTGGELPGQNSFNNVNNVHNSQQPSVQVSSSSAAAHPRVSETTNSAQHPSPTTGIPGLDTMGGPVTTVSLDQSGAGTHSPTSGIILSSGSVGAQQVAYLLEELSAAKELNKNLSEKLSRCEYDLDSTRIALNTKEVEADAIATGNVSAVIEEIYQAQKKREEAVMGRIKLANQERDEAMIQLKQYQRRLDSGSVLGDGEPENNSEDMEELDTDSILRVLSKLESPSKIMEVGDILANRIKLTNRREREINTEEMQRVLEERDEALARCQKLDKKLIQVQRQANPYSLNNAMDESLKAKLALVQQERDRAMLKVQELEEEMQTVRICHSLHKDVLTRNKLNNTVESYEVQLQQKDGYVDTVQKQNNLLLARLRGATDDLKKSHRELQATQVDKDKLERLVNVLRRKINSGSKLDEG